MSEGAADPKDPTDADRNRLRAEQRDKKREANKRKMDARAAERESKRRARAATKDNSRARKAAKKGPAGKSFHRKAAPGRKKTWGLHKPKWLQAIESVRKSVTSDIARSLTAGDLTGAKNMFLAFLTARMAHEDASAQEWLEWVVAEAERVMYELRVRGLPGGGSA